jgi:tRNA U38,U39,U40 pseudouridine synthase TruA
VRACRYCTLGKVYHYRIQTSPAVDPFTRHYALHFPFPLDIEAMEVAAEVHTPLLLPCIALTILPVSSTE